MPNFDPAEYFRSRTLADSGDKIRQLAIASKEKVASLGQYSAQLASEQEQNKNSLASKWVGDTDSVTGQLVNAAAEFYSGTSRLAGQLVSLPSGLEARRIEEQLGSNYYEEAAPGQGASTAELQKRAQVARERELNITQAFDRSDTVHQADRQKLGADLKAGFDTPWENVKASAQEAIDSRGKSGLGDTVAGMAEVLYNGGKALANNPRAVAGYALENVPQLALGAAGKVGSALMSASNVSYGSELYSRGIENYRNANNGAMPPEDVMRDMAMSAAAAIAAEQAGELFTLGSIKGVAKGTKDPIKEGFKQSLKSVSKAAGTNFVSEGSTEGVQTYLEGRATGEKVTASDIFSGAMIGGASGAQLAGGGRALAEISGNGEAAVAKRQENAASRAVYADAVAAKDPAVYLDSTNDNYSPSRAVGVLFEASRAKDVSTEDKATNLSQANDIVNNLDYRIETAKYDSEFLQKSPADRAATLAKEKERLAKVDPTNTVRVAAVTNAVAQLEAMMSMSPAEAKLKQQEVAKMEGEMTQATKVRDALTGLVNKPSAPADVKTVVQRANAAPTADPTADRVAVQGALTLAMASDSTLTPEMATQLAENKGNALTATERSHFVAYANARLAENALKSMGRVGEDILNGSKPDAKISYTGLNQYRSEISNAVAAGNEKQAKAKMEKLSTFATGQVTKAKTARQAIREQGKGATILNEGGKGWTISPVKMDYKDPAVKEMGGYVLSSAELVQNMVKEAKALQAIEAEMKSMLVVRFTPPSSTQATVPAKTVDPKITPAAQTTAAPTSVAPAAPSSNTGFVVDNAKATLVAFQKANPKLLDKLTELHAQDKTAAEIASDLKIDKDTVMALRIGLGLPSQGKASGSISGLGTPADVQERAAFEKWRDARTAPVVKAAPVVAEKPVVQSTPSPATQNISTDKNAEDKARLEQTTPEGTESSISEEEMAAMSNQDDESYLEPMSDYSDEASSSTETTEQAATEIEPGVLELYATEANPEAAYVDQNLIATQTTQSAGREDAGSKRPLVAIKDFLSYLAQPGADLSGFLKGAKDLASLSENQQAAIGHFAATAKKWAKELQKNLPKGIDPKFRYKDSIQFLVQKAEDGSLFLDANVMTAISAAAYTAVVNEASYGPYASKESTNQVLLQDKDADVTLVGDTLEMRSQRENMWRNSVGLQVIKALGIKANTEATADLLPRLASSFGAHAQVLLLGEKILVPTAVSAFDMAVLMGQVAQPSSTDTEAEKAVKAAAIKKLVADKTTTNLLSLNWQEGPNKGDPLVLHPNAAAMVEADKGSKQVLSKLLGTEDANSEPSLEAVPFTQANTDGTQEKVGSLAKEALTEKQATGNYLNQGMWRLVSMLPKELVMSMAGAVDEGNTTTAGKKGDSRDDVFANVEGNNTVHKVNRLRRKAKNDSLLREIDSMTGFVTGTLASSKDALESAFYFTKSVWKQQRVGLSTRALNPQQSKIHRFMTYMGSWNATIDPSNTDQMNIFKLRVLEGFGVKTEKQANLKNLPLFDAMFGSEVQSNPDAEKQRLANLAAVDAMVVGVMEGKELTAAQEDAIALAVKLGGQNFHTVSSLLGMAQFTYAKGKPFEMQLVAEVDGVNNGPTLSNVFYGAANSVAGLFERMNRGGIFEIGSKYKSFNEYRGTLGNKDLYESTSERLTTMLRESLGNSDVMAAIYGFTGSLTALDGSVTSKGRSFIKTAINAIHFGSSTNTAADNMANNFIESIYERIEKDASTNSPKDSAFKIIKDLNTLMGADKSNLHIPTGMSTQALLEYTLDSKQLGAIRFTFAETVGEATKSVIEGDFATYLSRRDTFNKVAQQTHVLYDSLVKGIRRGYIEELMDAHDRGEKGVAYIRRTDTRNGKKIRDPIHDLTKAQEREVAKRTEKLRPLIHTAMSKEDGDLNGGILLSKYVNTTSDKTSFTSEVHAGGRTMRALAEETQLDSPSVGGSSKTLHSGDSWVSLKAGLEHEVENLHDAHLIAALDAARGAQALNENAWKLLLNYSPTAEMYDMLGRFVGVFHDITSDGSLSDIELGFMSEALADTLNEQVAGTEYAPKVPSLAKLLEDMKFVANAADTMKLTSLAKVAVFDQYAFEGGAYQVTNDDRAEAEKKLAALQQTVPPATMEMAEAIDTMLRTNFALESKIKAQEAMDKRKATAALDSAVAKLPQAQTAQLLEHAAQDTTLSETMREQADKMLTHMTSRKGGLKGALNAVLTHLEIPSMVQLLTSRHAAIPAGLWGDLGTPTIAPDDTLVAALSKTGKMTAKAMFMTLQGMPNLNAFDQKLIKLMSRAINPDLEIRLITTATAAEMVLPNENGQVSGNLTKARGWFSISGGSEALYVLGTEFTQSGLTKELMIHELLHAALSYAIEGELKAPIAGPVNELVTELSALLSMAKAYAKENGLSQKYGHALTNVHELVSWGMTNQGFQEDVLKKVQFRSTTKGNPLVAGMKGFIDAIAKFLFKDPAASETNGLSVLLSNVSGLLAQSAQTKAAKDLSFTAMMATVAAGNGPVTYTTESLYEALGTLGATAHPVWDSHLKGLLNGIVTSLHGTYGSFKESLMKDQAITPSQILDKARITGVAPFASQALAMIATTEQEAFVLEQVEVTVREAVKDSNGNTNAIYSELSKLFLEVRAKLTEKDFENNGARTPTEAKALRDFIFTIDATNGDKTDHLSRFAAMGLAHEEFNGMLNFATQIDTRGVSDVKGFGAKLQFLFEKALALLSGKITRIVQGESAESRMTSLVRQLVDIEGKKQDKLNKPAGLDLMGNVDDAILTGATAFKAKLEDFSKMDVFTKSNRASVKLVGNALSIAANNRTMAFVGVIGQWQADMNNSKLNMAAHLLKDIAGGMVPKFQTLLRMAKNNEKIRKHLKTETSKFVMAGFENAGKNLDKAKKAAISTVFLRSGAHVLLDHFDMAGIEKLLASPAELDKAIATFQGKLGGFGGVNHYYANQANYLGYALATGERKSAMLPENAGNIARLYGTGRANKLSDVQTVAAEEAIDVLATLHALRYARPVHLKNALAVLKAENARTDNGNGVAGALTLHQHLEKDSKERLFGGNEALVRKGYTSEIYNPYIDIRVAEGVNGNQDLMDQGYSVGAVVNSDKAMPGQAVMRIHVLKDGGAQPLSTGSISYAGEHSRGASGVQSNATMFNLTGLQNAGTLRVISANKQPGINQLFQANPTLDASKVMENHMVPTFSGSGKVVDWRHMMADSTKDNLLERNNDFDEILGTFAGSTFDKAIATEQNTKAIEALREDYDDNIGNNSKDFLEVGPRSTDPEMREIYAMLPYATKEAIKATWGKDTMMVRKELLDITFGYHKLSLGSIFEKDSADRDVLEKVFAYSIEWMLKQSAHGQNAVLRRQGKPTIDPARYAKKAGHVVRKSERLWQEVVREAKDIIVVKSGSVMMGNIASNFMLLKMNGVPLLDILKHHQVAMQAGTEYLRDSGELAQLQLKLDAGYLIGDRAAVEQEVARLKNALARNPVRPLIDAGLMPTIVEDVGVDDNVYSYKSRLTRKVEGMTSGWNPTVVGIGKTVYMAHDTKLYKSLSHITQMSDFVARYTLYQHLTTRAKQPLSAEAAIQEASDAFINYDIPMHRKMQYGDDMGVFMFMKYAIRIQHVIAKLVKDHPGQVLETLLLHNYVDLMPTVLDSSMLTRIGSNPLGMGAFQLPLVMDELLIPKAAMSLFK
jgi:hypothetical protein